MATIFGGINFFLKIRSATQQLLYRSKAFVEIAVSSTVSEIQAFLCFAVLKKNRKFKMAAIFGK